MQRRRPAPVAKRRKTADGHDFLPTGNVLGAPRQRRHGASFCTLGLILFFPFCFADSKRRENTGKPRL